MGISDGRGQWGNERSARISMMNESRQSSEQSGALPEGCSLEDHRRELELELIKIRSEAVAARLEAKAAELELTIRRINRSALAKSDLMARVESADTVSPSAPHTTTPSASSDSAHVSGQAQAHSASQPSISAPSPLPTAFASWDAVREATATASQSVAVSEAAAKATLPTPQDDVIGRIDSASERVPRPKFLDENPNEFESIDEDSGQNLNVPVVDDDPASEEAHEVVEEPLSAGSSSPIPIPLRADSGPRQANVDAQDVELDAVEEPEEQRRKSPAALLVSTAMHIVILILLATFTLSNQTPKDQVALSASVSNPSEESMETFEIETSEPEAEPTPSETEYELSPLGEMKVTEFSPDAPPAPPAPVATAMLSSSQMSAASMELQSDSDAKIQFCGVEGGGNHFVYLVDSSGSMGAGFESARTELLQSIDVLKSDQRFYVVFFDAEPDYMRLSDPNTDEPRSAYATPENKQALKRWAMRITKNKGRAPYDPLEFALELKPDVIFLLSDGEFPQGIEDLLKEQNRFENLFGDSGPISIVHTIGYHSREGESRMKRIAQQNKGQYRHVPKP